MEMRGEQLIAADRARTWAALNDPETLKACIPGCESITPAGENQYEVLMTARVGPVSAKFKGKLALADVNPPQSYSIAFEGQGGTAGFGKGGAKVELAEEGPNTRLTYDVTAQVGGKLAQIGSRLVDAAARKIAADFFERFNEKVATAAASAPTAELRPASSRSSTLTKVVIAGVALVLAIALLAWFVR